MPATAGSTASATGPAGASDSAPFTDLVPLLMCEDVQASIRFYQDVLGFVVTGRMDDVGTTGFAALANGKARLMLASPAYQPQAVKVDGRYPQCAYYIYVADADALRQRVVRHGWPASECVDRFYGLREFEVADPDGHVLLLGHDLEAAATDASSLRQAPGDG